MFIDTTKGPRQAYFTSNDPSSSLYPYPGVKSSGPAVIRRTPGEKRAKQAMDLLKQRGYEYDEYLQAWVPPMPSTPLNVEGIRRQAA